MRRFLFVIAGVLCAGLGLKSFLLPNGFLDGGVMGIALLIVQMTGLPLSVLVVGLNLPFVVMGFFQMGRRFAISVFFSILGLAVTLWVIQYPVLTHDPLLISVFGGVFLGAGIGLCIRGGSAIDGTEILALYVSRRTGMPVGHFIFLINIVVFSVSGWLLSLEIALYSMLTYFAASQTIDFVVHGLEEYMGVTVVSAHKSDEIRRAIIYQMGRGVTIFNGKSGFGKHGHQQELDVVYTVVTRLELVRLRLLIADIDARAFVVVSPVHDFYGGMVKQRFRLH